MTHLFDNSASILIGRASMSLIWEKNQITRASKVSTNKYPSGFYSFIYFLVISHVYLVSFATPIFVFPLPDLVPLFPIFGNNS